MTDNRHRALAAREQLAADDFRKSLAAAGIKVPVVNDDLRKVLSEAVVDIPTAGRVLGLGEAAARRAAADGSIPAFRVGRRFRVSTFVLRRMLGIAEQEPAANAA